MLMNVLLIRTAATVMLTVQIHMVASPVHVTRDTLEMESHVLVRRFCEFPCKTRNKCRLDILTDLCIGYVPLLCMYTYMCSMPNLTLLHFSTMYLLVKQCVVIFYQSVGKFDS